MDVFFFHFGVPASVFFLKKGRSTLMGKKSKVAFYLFLLKEKGDACAGNILSKRLRKIVSSIYFRKKDLTFFNSWRILLGSLLFV
jgi:hypothetical protein